MRDHSVIDFSEKLKAGRRTGGSMLGMTAKQTRKVAICALILFALFFAGMFAIGAIGAAARQPVQPVVILEKPSAFVERFLHRDAHIKAELRKALGEEGKKR